MKKNKKTTPVAVILIWFLITGCATGRVARLKTEEKEGSPALFITKIPKNDYDEIAYIQADGSVFHTPQKLLNVIKKRAVLLGADAVINIKYDFQAWYPVASGVAIKYKE